MSLFGHLSELRVRLTYAAIAIFIGFFAAYAFHLELFELIVFPVRDSLAERGLYRLQALHVTESIFVYLKLSVVVGIMGAFPFILYQIWAFIAPGLLEEERRYVTPIVVFSTLFFGLGVLFAYTVLIPFVTGFLTDLTIGSSGIELQVTVQNVFSFSLLSLLLFGLVFQLPILMFFLALLGVADHRSFAGFFRFFIVISFVVGAMLTPPEPVSQILMALPMNLLYGLGIVFAFLVGKRQVDPETDELVPIGLRVWLTVGGVMALFVGGIVGGVWLLQPAPKGSELVPSQATVIAGIHPGQASEMGLVEPLVRAAGLRGESVSNLREGLNSKEALPVFAFFLSTGDGALLLERKEAERMGIEALFTTDSSHPLGIGKADSPDPAAPVLESISSDWLAIGRSEAIAALQECTDDSEKCASADPEVSKRLVALRTSGPAWVWLGASDSGKWTIPGGDSVGSLREVAWHLDTEKGTEVQGSLRFETEASAEAYRTRIDLWREQQELAEQEAESSRGLNEDLRTLASTVSTLATATIEALNVVSEQAPPESRDQLKRARRKVESQLDGIQAQVGRLQETKNEAQVEPVATHEGFITSVPSSELQDWSITTDGSESRFVVQLSKAGLREWIRRVPASAEESAPKPSSEAQAE